MSENMDYNKETPTKKGKKLTVVIITAAAAVIAILAAVILYCILPHGTEIFEAPVLRTDNSPFSYICKVSEGLDKVNCEKLGSYDIKIQLLGFLELPSSVKVRDTKAPLLRLRDLTLPRGVIPYPEDFIESAEDKTSLSFSFAAIPNTNNNGTVTVVAKDEGENISSAEGSFKTYDSFGRLDIEKGASYSEILELISAHIGKNVTDIIYDTESSGESHVIAVTETDYVLVVVNTEDTTPPECHAVSYDILMGTTLSENDFVTDVKEASAYTVEYVTSPDFSKVGHQTVELSITDEYGNKSKVSADLNIHKLETPLTVEAGTSAKSLGYMISNMLGTDEPLPRITESFEPEYLGLGSHMTELVGEYSAIPIEVIIEDTTPPLITLRRLTVYVGNSPKVTDFITECTDESGVHFKFKEEPDAGKAGNFIVTVIATDSAGNSAEYSTSLKVTRDDVPPTFYGVSDIEVFEGDTVSYRSGVSAIDDKDGKVNVKVDASEVNTAVPGTYFAIYTASDSDGNTATKTAAVTVKPITIGAAYALAEEILSEITTDSMTDREKARAIYDWSCANIKYSTLTSHLMGYYAKAAYSGFTKHYGNCYTYYAVTSVLLSKAGITNIQIERNSKTDPHYWNLVNIDGSWYHLDTCPQPPPHKLEVFLLTDSEVRAFTRDKVANYYNFNADNYPATP